jgi:hypothetical protein
MYLMVSFVGLVPAIKDNIGTRIIAVGLPDIALWNNLAVINGNSLAKGGNKFVSFPKAGQ